MGGRFGKYGDFKRRQNLRKGRSVAQGLIKGLKKFPKGLSKPIQNEPTKKIMRKGFKGSRVKDSSERR